MAYKRATKAAKFAIDCAKTQCYDKLCLRLSDQTTAPKQYWNIMKRLNGNKIKSGIPAIIDNNQAVSSSSCKAIIFNAYFAEQSTLPDPTQSVSLPNPYFITDSRLSYVRITPEKVFKCLSKLDTNRANGPDGVSNRLLKETASSIANPLSLLFNKSISDGVFPQSWKEAIITHVHKKNDKQN